MSSISPGWVDVIVLADFRSEKRTRVFGDSYVGLQLGESCIPFYEAVSSLLPCKEADCSRGGRRFFSSRSCFRTLKSLVISFSFAVQYHIHQRLDASARAEQL